MKLKSLVRMWSLVILGIVMCSALSRPAAADEIKVTKKIEQEFQAVQKAVADPLADEHLYFSARGRLQSLQSRTEEMIKKYAGRDEEGHRLHKLHGEILAELKTVNSRLPAPPIRPVGRGLPVPNFDPDKKLGQLAAELQQAQTALSESLISKSKSNSPLVQMILAQEQLAWEAGWPFTRKEASLFRSAKGLTAEIYHMRRNRGIERINNQLAREAAKVGREPPQPFVIHHPKDEAAHDTIHKQLIEKHGKAAKSWTKGTQPFDEKAQSALTGTR